MGSKLEQCVFVFLLVGICWMVSVIGILMFLMWTPMGNNIIDSYFGVNRGAYSEAYEAYVREPSQNGSLVSQDESLDAPASPEDSFDLGRMSVSSEADDICSRYASSEPERGYGRPEVKRGTIDHGHGVTNWESGSHRTPNSNIKWSSSTYTSKGSHSTNKRLNDLLKK